MCVCDCVCVCVCVCVSVCVSYVILFPSISFYTLVPRGTGERSNVVSAAEGRVFGTREGEKQILPRRLLPPPLHRLLHWGSKLSTGGVVYPFPIFHIFILLPIPWPNNCVSAFESSSSHLVRISFISFSDTHFLHTFKPHQKYLYTQTTSEYSFPFSLSFSFHSHISTIYP